MNNTFTPLLRTFLTGVLAVLPLAATLGLFVWLWRLLASWLGPDSLFGSLLVAIGLSVTTSRTVGYLLGLLALVAAIYLLGVLVENEFQRGMRRVVDAVMRRIPLVRSVYDLASRMVDLFSKRNPDGMNSMAPVWLYFGGKPNDADQKDSGKVAVLAMLCTPEPVVLQGRRYHGVVIPSAPVPVGGGLLYVPEEWVTPADVGMEGLTSIYVSMGLTTSQYVEAAKPTVPA